MYAYFTVLPTKRLNSIQILSLKYCFFIRGITRLGFCHRNFFCNEGGQVRGVVLRLWKTLSLESPKKYIFHSRLQNFYELNITRAIDVWSYQMNTFHSLKGTLTNAWIKFWNSLIYFHQRLHRFLMTKWLSKGCT